MSPDAVRQSISRANVWESIALVAVGLLLACVGCLWWIFDAHPQHGRVLIVGGLAVAGVGALVRSHNLGYRARLAVAAAVVLLAVVAGFELRDAVQEIKEDRAPRMLILR